LADCGDNTMAAHAYSGPVAVQEAPPPPAVSASRSTGEGAIAVPAADDADAPAPDDEDDDDDDDDGGVWDTASLYEEILDEVEAFEYSRNGEPARPCAALHAI
jgi:NAD-dependent histone deacetylase SIR2